MADTSKYERLDRLLAECVTCTRSLACEPLSERQADMLLASIVLLNDPATELRSWIDTCLLACERCEHACARENQCDECACADACRTYVLGVVTRDPGASETPC